MLSKIFNKNPTESLTFWGLVLMGIVQTLEATAVVPPGTGAGLVAVAEKLGGLLVILGIRRAANSPPA